MSVDSFGRPNPVLKRHRGVSLAPDVFYAKLVRHRPRGPNMGNPILKPASVYLPIAGSTQEDLALFSGC